MRIWWVVILDIWEGCASLSSGHASVIQIGSSGSLPRLAAAPASAANRCRGFSCWGFNRLGWERNQWVGKEKVSGMNRATKKPCCHFGRAGLSLGKAGLLCHAAHSCLCSRASGLGLLQSRPFNAWVMTILPNWPHRTIPRRSESAWMIAGDVRW